MAAGTVMRVTARQKTILEKADVCREKRARYVRALAHVDNSESYLPTPAVHRAEDEWHKSETELLHAVQRED